MMDLGRARGYLTLKNEQSGPMSMSTGRWILVVLVVLGIAAIVDMVLSLYELLPR